MKKLLTPAIILFCASMSASYTFAQENETETVAEENTSGLSIGEVVSEGPQVGETYTKTENGDWAIRCIKVETGEDPCKMQQFLKDQEGGIVAEITLGPISSGGQVVAGANLITPLETMLQKQATIKIGDRPSQRYPFAFCAKMGCISRIGLTADDITAYKNGSTAQITIVPFAAPDTPFVLELSLAGFTASYTSLQ